MKSVEIQLKKSKIVSPISGFVIEKFIDGGEFVSIGSPIAKIANLDEVYVRIYVPEKELVYINPIAIVAELALVPSIMIGSSTFSPLIIFLSKPYPRVKYLLLISSLD